jgi:hypothetical protein
MEMRLMVVKVLHTKNLLFYAFHCKTSSPQDDVVLALSRTEKNGGRFRAGRERSSKVQSSGVIIWNYH